ncbi:LysR family transcriptional regulator [Roseovarius sp. 2305UL8-3]|uniref:LysR family transcriptional regulator n=1 Tax=Roseovarius conchicola TaxID=3121636 RepID=UPI003528BCD7
MVSLKEKLPPANALVVFEAAGRHLNFSRAGEELSVVQPAITRQIRNLENSLHVRLFRRNNNQLSLTAEGVQLHHVVQESLQKIAALSEVYRGRQTEKLLIGSTFAFANLWLSSRLPALRRVLPETHLNLLISEQYDDFNTGPSDISIRFGTGTWPDMKSHLLFNEEVYPIASRKLVERHRIGKTLNWADVRLLDQPNTTRDLNWMTWLEWQDRTKNTDFEACERIEFDNYLYVLDAVRLGEGVALGMAGLTAQYEANNDLVRVGPSVKRQKAGYYLVHHDWHPGDKLMSYVLKVLQAPSG